jgi:hypothetical protein
LKKPPTDRSDLRRLHFINALFSHVTGDDLYLANQIKEGIAFSLAELRAQAREHPEYAERFDAEFNAAAARLIGRLAKEEGGRGFFHWDAAATAHSATPLFARAEITAALKGLARHREALLLVTNLRPALVPAGRRATPRRKGEYSELLTLIRELAAARTARHSQLQLLFL